MDTSGRFRAPLWFRQDKERRPRAESDSSPARPRFSRRAFVERLDQRVLLTAPIGVLDAISNDGFVGGWAFDPDTKSSPIFVDMYIDNVMVARTQTTFLRTDVNSVYGTTGTHGFNVAIPATSMNGQQHRIDLYALDSSGLPPNPLFATRFFTLFAPKPADLSQTDPSTGQLTDAITGHMTDAEVSGPVQFQVNVDGGATWTSPLYQTDPSRGGYFEVHLPPLKTVGSTSQVEVVAYNRGATGRDTHTAITYQWLFANTPITASVTPILKSTFPTNFLDNQTLTFGDVYYYQEQSNKTLTADLPLSAAGQGNYIGTDTALDPGVYYPTSGTQYPDMLALPKSSYPAVNQFVPSGTSVQSYYVHFDPTPDAYRFVEGYLYFQNPIYGVITEGNPPPSSSDLSRADSLVGRPGVTYSDNGLNILGKGGSFDSIRILGDLHTIEFALRARVEDDFRVITQIDPPPPPPPNIAPYFTMPSDTFAIDENKTQVGQVTATDPDNGPSPLTFSVDQSTLDGGLFAITPAGALSFIAAPDFENPLDHGHDNTYDLNVSVSDGSATVTKHLQVVVSDVTTTSFVVNQGATNRSFISRLDVGLEDVASAPSLLLPGRIRLVRRDTATSAPVIVVAGTSRVVGGVLTIDFGPLGLTGNYNSTVGNGIYQLLLDTKGTGSFDTALEFHRLLGDVNGDRRVDDADIAAIDHALALGVWDINADLNGDGFVNALDRLLAVRSRGRSL